MLIKLKSLHWNCTIVFINQVKIEDQFDIQGRSPPLKARKRSTSGPCSLIFQEDGIGALCISSLSPRRISKSEFALGVELDALGEVGGRRSHAGVVVRVVQRVVLGGTALLVLERRRRHVAAAGQRSGERRRARWRRRRVNAWWRRRVDRQLQARRVH